MFELRTVNRANVIRLRQILPQVLADERVVDFEREKQRLLIPEESIAF